jgi:hypothetical protein
VHAVGVFDHQLTTVVLLGSAEEERRRDVGADAVRRPRHLPDRIVDVRAERLAALVAVEERREDLERERRGDEERAALKRREHRLSELFRLRAPSASCMSLARAD